MISRRSFMKGLVKAVAFVAAVPIAAKAVFYGGPIGGSMSDADTIRIMWTGNLTISTNSLQGIIRRSHSHNGKMEVIS